MEIFYSSIFTAVFLPQSSQPQNPGMTGQQIINRICNNEITVDSSKKCLARKAPTSKHCAANEPRPVIVFIKHHQLMNSLETISEHKQRRSTCMQYDHFYSPVTSTGLSKSPNFNCCPN